MGTVRPASSLKRIGFVRGHIAFIDDGLAHLGECECKQNSQTRPRPGSRYAG
jgi:hypothetical protein